MPKPPKAHNEIEGDPKEGDAILKRMLQMKPKPQKELVQKNARPSQKPSRASSRQKSKES
jgi:hypothetical protein